MVLNVILRIPERSGVLIEYEADAWAHARNKILKLTMMHEKNKHAE